jgi:hypothetical protein
MIARRRCAAGIDFPAFSGRGCLTFAIITRARARGLAATVRADGWKILGL